ncbi:MAG: hypothetical protein ACOY90_19405 [Candidatus Zhuqueibacterota bacterium]
MAYGIPDDFKNHRGFLFVVRGERATSSPGRYSGEAVTPGTGNFHSEISTKEKRRVVRFFHPSCIDPASQKILLTFERELLYYP